MSRLSDLAKDPNLFEDDEAAPDDMRKMFQHLLRAHQDTCDSFKEVKKTLEIHSLAILDLTSTLKEVMSRHNRVRIATLDFSLGPLLRRR